MTRAEKLLCLSHADVRMRFGRMVTCRPSPYLMDVPEDAAVEMFLPPETKQPLVRDSFERKRRVQERRSAAPTAAPADEPPDREEPPFDPNEEPMPQDLLHEDGMDGPPPGLDEPSPFADDAQSDRYGPSRGAAGCEDVSGPEGSRVRPVARGGRAFHPSVD